MKKIYTLLILCVALAFGSQVQAQCYPNVVYTTDTNNMVHFNITNPSTHWAYSYSWDFGDGSPMDTGVSVSHQYNSSGVYVVFLDVDTFGMPCGTRMDSVFVNYCGANFTSQVGANGTVNFSSQAFYPTPYGVYGVTIHWDFGDGNSSTQIKNPSHTYNSAGTYYITHTVIDTFHQVTCSFTDSIVIAGSPQNCNASYSVVKDSLVPFGVILYNTSSNAPSHQYSWDFGDGQTGTGRTPNHHYQNFGNYLVCLTITDSILNCTSTFCDSVGMDSLGNLKASGFGLEVRNNIITSINESEKSGFEKLSIYPNPATTEVSIDLSGLDEQVNIRLMDLSGKMILSETNVQNGIVKQLDISDLSNGFYFLSIENENNRRVEKIVKVK